MDLRKTFVKMNDILIHQVEHANHIRHEMEGVKLGIMNLVKGKLSPLLLTPYVIASSLRNIHALIKRKNPGFLLIHKTAQDVYAANSYILTRTHSTL